MSKLASYIGIWAVTLVAAFQLELLANTGTSALVSWLSNPAILFQTTFYTNLNNILSLFAAGGVIIGLFFSQKVEQATTIGFVGVLLLTGKDMITVYQNISSINPDFALLFFSPFLLLYSLTVIEWWRSVN